jgi:CheY-like chemotaxis protein
MNTSIRSRILLVDNGSQRREDLASALRSAGCLVDLASSGSRAMIAADQVAPDLVVLGVDSLHLDGFELTALLRARGIGVPVIFLAAREGRQETVAGLPVGGDAYLTRHKASTELIALVAPILQRAGVRTGSDDLLRCDTDETDGRQRLNLDTLLHLYSTKLTPVTICRSAHGYPLRHRTPSRLGRSSSARFPNSTVRWHRSFRTPRSRPTKLAGHASGSSDATHSNKDRCLQ